MTSLHVICGLSPPIKNPGYAFECLCPSMTRLSCISLFSTGAKSGSFYVKKFAFGSPLLAKSWLHVLVAFTTVDFSSDYWPQTKRAEKRCRPYFKIAHNCSRTRSEDQFLLANFTAPPLLADAFLLRLLWRRHCVQFWIQATCVVGLLRTCDALIHICDCETATC